MELVDDGASSFSPVLRYVFQIPLGVSTLLCAKRKLGTGKRFDCLGVLGSH